jgi:glycosyltransferase involved in cell wall biosynthesis
MKVLLITDTHKLVGGAEKHLFVLKNKLIEDGHKTYSLGFSGKDELGVDYKTIKETRFLIVRQFWRMFFNPVKYRQLRSYIKKIEPDVIHLHNINKYTISLLKAVKGYNTVQTVHDYGLVCPNLWNIHEDLNVCPTGMTYKCMFRHRGKHNIILYLSQLYFFFKRNKLLKKTINKYIAPTPLLKEYLENNDFKKAYFIPYLKEDISYNSQFEAIKRNNILYIGQLEENKGVHLLIEAMKTVVYWNPSVKLKICGSGSQEKLLKGKTHGLGLESHITFLGRIQNVNEINKLYEETSAVIVPSIWMENSPIVIQEAMAHSRPVIGSNRGGIPWLIEDNKSGLIFDIKKENDLSDKIIELLNNPKQIKQFAISANDRFYKIFNNKEIMKNIFQIYNSDKLS